jgi:hypothetical protein
VSRAALVVVLVAFATAPACSTIEKQRADGLGPEVETPGPRHRPGQPCLWCHSSVYGDGRARPSFDLAGTVYRRRGDTDGAPGLEIDIEDAAGHRIVVNANVAGNFALVVEDGLGAPVETDEGIWRVPGPLVFPLRTSVAAGGLKRNMENVIHRERSCAVCHTDAPGAASNGRIYVQAEPADAGVTGVADAATDAAVDASTDASADPLR